MNTKDEIIADLYAENARIKKTSKARFEENKILKHKAARLERLGHEVDTALSYIDKKGFPIMRQDGLQPRVDWTVNFAFKALSAKSESLNSPSVNGIYAVRIDGELVTAKIWNSICWKIKFNDGSSAVLHHVDIKEFILIEPIQL